MKTNDTAMLAAVNEVPVDNSLRPVLERETRYSCSVRVVSWAMQYSASCSDRPDNFCRSHCH